MRHALLPLFSPLANTPHNTSNGDLSITCADRHCPKCQALARAEWLENRRSELLNTQYFHVVFTLPEQIAPIAYQNKKVVYGILFRATAETLRTIAADPKHLGAEIGFFAVLHSWGQNLLHHPHLHCVVAGGGLSPDGTRWISCRPGFFLPVRVLSRLFRRLFLDYLIKAFDAGKLDFFSALEPLRERGAFLRHLAPTRATEWVVYAKRPFAGARITTQTTRAIICAIQVLSCAGFVLRFVSPIVSRTYLINCTGTTGAVKAVDGKNFRGLGRGRPRAPAGSG